MAYCKQGLVIVSRAGLPRFEFHVPYFFEELLFCDISKLETVSEETLINFRAKKHFINENL